jgi:hypothetical protein
MVVGKVTDTEMARLPEIEQAEKQILAHAVEQERWSPKALRQSSVGDLEPQVVSLAFWRLLNQGQLVLDPDLQVRVSPSH